MGCFGRPDVASELAVDNDCGRVHTVPSPYCSSLGSIPALCCVSFPPSLPLSPCLSCLSPTTYIKQKCKKKKKKNLFTAYFLIVSRLHTFSSPPLGEFFLQTSHSFAEPHK